MSFKVNQRVELLNKNCQGTVKFVGNTSFGAGNWVGIVLDEPLGKNNGSVQGRTYFKCAENHGIFVRSHQVVLIGDTTSKASSRRSSLSLDDENDKIALNKRKSNISIKELKSTPTFITRSRQSLNSSKLSLSTSRQSLNESQLASISPVNSNSDVNLNNSELDNDTQQSSLKCESFIETEFVGNLTPEFKQPSPRSYLQQVIDEKYYLELQESNTNLTTQAENLKKQINELREEHEKLLKVRDHDKEKIKDYELLKLHNNQLSEFKVKIMENHQNIQREFQKAKSELVDLQNLRDSHTQEMNELMNLLEMTTLDKEMAEERVELVQADLDLCREQMEELRLELRILREEVNNQDEISDIDDKDNDKVRCGYQMKHFEQQNKRLREVLIKMRDVAATEKNNYQKLIKELETKESEINELSKIKEKLSSRVEEQENQIFELQAQVDATLGSEEMIVLLTDKKLSLEEHVEQLENNLIDLQNIKDVLEQINEANHEINVDLREEIEMQQMTISKLKMKNDSLIEIIADRELTINKFRDLVQQLQEQLRNLREMLNQQQQMSFVSISNSSLTENIEFQKILNKTKEYFHNVDFELRKIEVQELLQHVNYLMSFMPNSFKNHPGGDHDAILTLLLISRLNLKTDVLLNQIRDKFSNVEKLDRNLILTDHYLQQFTFRTRFCTHIGVLQCLLHQYSFMLNTCTVESLNNTTEVYNEIMSQEKLINNFLDLLKKNELDENQNLESLERSIVYFYTMLPILMESENVWNQLDLLNDFLAFLSLNLEEFQAYIELLKYFALSNAQGSHEFEQLLEFCSNCLQKWYQQRKQLKRKLTSTNVQDPSLGLEQRDLFESVFRCYFYSLKLSKTLLKMVEGALKIISQRSLNIENDIDINDVGIGCDELMELAISSSNSVYEQDDLGPLISIKESLDYITNRFDSLLQYFEDNESSLINAKKTIHIKRKPPIAIKADIFKNEMEEVKELREKIERKDSDIQMFQVRLRKMQENISEMKLRKDIAEKKLDNVQNYKSKIDTLIQEIDILKTKSEMKNKEHENICSNLRNELKSLEKEHCELKEKLKYSTTKKGHSVISDSETYLGSNDVLIEEVQSLKRSIQVLNFEKMELISNNLIERIERLKPIKFLSVNDLRKEKLMILDRELSDIYDDMLSIYAQYKVIDWNNRNDAFWKLKERLQQKQHLRKLNDRFCQIKNEISNELMNRQKGCKISGDFKDFPTINLIESLKESEPMIMGEIKIPNLLKKPVKTVTTVIVHNKYELENIFNCLKS